MIGRDKICHELNDNVEPIKVAKHFPVITTKMNIQFGMRLIKHQTVAFQQMHNLI